MTRSISTRTKLVGASVKTVSIGIPERGEQQTADSKQQTANSKQPESASILSGSASVGAKQTAKSQKPLAVCCWCLLFCCPQQKLPASSKLEYAGSLIFFTGPLASRNDDVSISQSVLRSLQCITNVIKGQVLRLRLFAVSSVPPCC